MLSRKITIEYNVENNYLRRTTLLWLGILREVGTILMGTLNIILVYQNDFVCKNPGFHPVSSFSCISFRKFPSSRIFGVFVCVYEWGLRSRIVARFLECTPFHSWWLPPIHKKPVSSCRVVRAARHRRSCCLTDPRCLSL